MTGSPSSAQTANDVCRVCGGRARPALAARDRVLGEGGTFDYLECEACGCLQIREVPDDLESHYPADYYTRQRPPAFGRRAGRSRRLWTQMRIAAARRRPLRLGKRFGGYAWFASTGTGLDDRILDVGCGTGRLLRRLWAAGFTRLTGIDERLAEEVRGPGMPILLRRRLEEHEGRYRLVMAHHSFEHVRDPRRAFRALARLVAPGGWLLLRVPRADGEARRRYGVDWVQLDAPRHLHLHTVRSVEALARGTPLRLVDHVDDSGPFQIWGSELHRRGERVADAGRGGRRRFSMAARLRFRWRARRLRRAGRGDQVCFYLRRDPVT